MGNEDYTDEEAKAALNWGDHQLTSDERRHLQVLDCMTVEHCEQQHAAELAELRERCARLERERDEAREELSLIESDTEWRTSVWEALAAMRTELAVHPAKARDRCASLEAALREWGEWVSANADSGITVPTNAAAVALGCAMSEPAHRIPVDNGPHSLSEYDGSKWSEFKPGEPPEGTETEGREAVTQDDVQQWLRKDGARLIGTVVGVPYWEVRGPVQTVQRLQSFAWHEAALAVSGRGEAAWYERWESIRNFVGDSVVTQRLLEQGILSKEDS